jgi:hypothetical protein
MDILPIGIEGPLSGKAEKRDPKGPEEALPPQRDHLGTGGEIISEWVAISNRNQWRLILGIGGDLRRNQHARSKA